MKEFETGCEGMDKRTKAYRQCLEQEAAEKSLGDYVEDFTEATGIKKAVEWFSELTGIDCGCEERKEKLNNLFRRRRRVVNCMTKKQFVEWEHIRNHFSGKAALFKTHYLEGNKPYGAAHRFSLVKNIHPEPREVTDFEREVQFPVSLKLLYLVLVQ